MIFFESKFEKATENDVINGKSIDFTISEKKKILSNMKSLKTDNKSLIVPYVYVPTLSKYSKVDITNQTMVTSIVDDGIYEIRLKIQCTVDNFNESNHVYYLTIIKMKDDYFFISVADNDVGTGYVKCDQIDEVIEYFKFLKEKILEILSMEKERINVKYDLDILLKKNADMESNLITKYYDFIERDMFGE